MSQGKYDLIEEAAIDIALNAGYMMAKGEISVTDSRELVGFIKAAARTFELIGYDTEDYIGQVDMFAKDRLTKRFGASPAIAVEQRAQLEDEIYIIYSCDDGKSYDSMRLVGATTNEDTLFSIIGNEILEDRMSYRGQSKKIGFITFRQDFQNNNIELSALGNGFVHQTDVEQIDGYLTSDEYLDIYDLLHMDDGDFLEVFYGDQDLSSDETTNLEYDDKPDLEDGMEP